VVDISENRCSASSVNSVASSHDDSLPDCWNAKQRDKFQQDNMWLTVNNGKLGCRVCCAVANQPEINTVLSCSWVEGTVAPNGQTKETRQSSLRKKIYEHRTSQNHVQAVKILDDQKSDAIRCGMANALQQQHEHTCRVFSTAYYIAKQERPYTDHPELVTLQQENGVDMGIGESFA